MKTINDLMQLISKEIELNEGKLVKYSFNVDTDDMFLTMKEHAEITNWDSGQPVTEKKHAKTIFSFERYNTPEKLQYLYWKVFINGRSGIEKSCTEL